MEVPAPLQPGTVWVPVRKKHLSEPEHSESSSQSPSQLPPFETGLATSCSHGAATKGTVIARTSSLRNQTKPGGCAARGADGESAPPCCPGSPPLVGDVEVLLSERRAQTSDPTAPSKRNLSGTIEAAGGREREREPPAAKVAVARARSGSEEHGGPAGSGRTRRARSHRVEVSWRRSPAPPHDAAGGWVAAAREAARLGIPLRQASFLQFFSTAETTH